LNNNFINLYNLLPLKIQKYWNRIEDSDIGSRIAKGAFWSILGSASFQGLILISSIVVARIIGKREYGELGMIRSTVNMFSVFAGFGLGLTATKYVAELYRKDKLRTGRIIGLSTLFSGGTGALIAIIILLTAPTIATKTINAPHLVNEIRLSSILLFFSALNGAQTGTLVGYEAFRTIAKVNFITGVLTFPVQIGLTLLFGLKGSILGLGFSFILLWILNFIAIRKESSKADVIISYKDAWIEWPILYKFSLPALLSGLLVSPAMWICNTMLVNQPKGYEEMAIYDAANQWRTMILFVPAVLSQIALPLLSGTAHDQNKFNRILKLNVIINLIFSVLMAITVSLLATSIMKTYGNGFSNGRIVLIILAISAILVTFNNVIGQAISGKGQMWFGFVLNLIWSLVLLASTYLFINIGFGAKGLAYSTLISYAFHTFFQIIFISKYLNIKINHRYNSI